MPRPAKPAASAVAAVLLAERWSRRPKTIENPPHPRTGLVPTTRGIRSRLAQASTGASPHAKFAAEWESSDADETGIAAAFFQILSHPWARFYRGIILPCRAAAICQRPTARTQAATAK